LSPPIPGVGEDLSPAPPKDDLNERISQNLVLNLDNPRKAIPVSEFRLASAKSWVFRRKLPAPLKKSPRNHPPLALISPQNFKVLRRTDIHEDSILFTA
jgi:hypothetical protein